MRNLLLTILVACAISCSAATVRAQNYGRSISVPKDAGPRLQASVADLQDYVQRITGKEFRLDAKRPAEGIVVAFASPQAPAELVEQLNTAAGPPRFFNADGREVKPHFVDGGKLILIDVPADQAGRVWSLSHAKTPNEPMRFLNAPQTFAFFWETVLVPLDSIDKRK